MKNFVSVIFTLFIFLMSCNKNSSGDQDNVFPVVTIANPLQNQTFTSGQQINITGTISDNTYIAEVHIHITNNNTGALLMDVHQYPGGSSATFNQSITAVSGVVYKIQVIAKDRAVNETTSTVEVVCN